METVEIAAIAIVFLLGVLGWVLRRIMANTSETRDIAVEIKTEQAVQGNRLAQHDAHLADHESRIRTLEHPRVRPLQGETRYP